MTEYPPEWITRACDEEIADRKVFLKNVKDGGFSEEFVDTVTTFADGYIAALEFVKGLKNPEIWEILTNFTETSSILNLEDCVGKREILDILKNLK